MSRNQSKIRLARIDTIVVIAGSALSISMVQTARQQATNIFQAGVKAADPGTAVKGALRTGFERIPGGRLLLLAVGKAAPSMATAALELLQPDTTIIVSHDPASPPVPGAQMITASHPVPDKSSQNAARIVETALCELGERDHVLALISGGASALVCAPIDGISLADKIAVNQLLLGAGLDIGAMNLVRQNLSCLKGGGMLQMAAPARVTSLILSDVIGNDLRIVASGPTVAPIGGNAQARAALEKAGVWHQLPGAAQKLLTKPDAENTALPPTDNRLIGSNEHSVAAMALAAPDAAVHAEPLIGDVADAARIVASKVAGTHLFGGETTVRLQGSGLGGRNQELALRVAILAEQNNWQDGWVFLSGGTDGRDGPTDAAGGLVDGGTLTRMRAAGVDPAAMLANNDSYHALQTSSDLLVTGATGTNVADLQVLIKI